MLYTVQNIEDKSSRVRLLRLAASGGAPPMEYQAGQYARLGFADFDPRPFSIAGPPGGQTLDFLVTRGGNGVRDYATNSLVIGEKVEVDGPFGDMTRQPDDTTPIVMIAGGSGIAPIRLLIEEYLSGDFTQPVLLYYGVRSMDEIIDLPALDEMAKTSRNFSHHVILSDTPDPGGIYRTGFLGDAVREDFEDLSGHRVFISGPPPMIRSVLPDLAALGLPAEKLHTDRENLDSADLEVLTRTG